MEDSNVVFLVLIILLVVLALIWLSRRKSKKDELKKDTPPVTGKFEQQSFQDLVLNEDAMDNDYKYVEDPDEKEESVDLERVKLTPPENTQT